MSTFSSRFLTLINSSMVGRAMGDRTPGGVLSKPTLPFHQWLDEQWGTALLGESYSTLHCHFINGWMSNGGPHSWGSPIQTYVTSWSIVMLCCVTFIHKHLISSPCNQDRWGDNKSIPRMNKTAFEGLNLHFAKYWCNFGILLSLMDLRLVNKFHRQIWWVADSF